MIAEIYRQRLAHFQATLADGDKQIRYLSWARVAVALVILFALYFGFQQSLYFLPAGLLTILFFVLVRIQLQREEKQKITQQLVTLQEAELLALEGDHSRFADGTIFNDPHHPYSYDLDLFGNGSVFQYLNRCATAIGEKQLSEELLHPLYSREVVQQRQNAIREMASALDFRQQCWATGKVLTDQHFNLMDLYYWLQEPDLFYRKRTFELIRWIMPFVTIGTLVSTYWIPQATALFFLLMGVQLTVTGFYSKPIAQLQQRLSTYRHILESYSRLFFLMKDQSWNSDWIKQHQQYASKAAEAVKQLSSRANALESRMNAFARLFGNGIFLYDFHAVVDLEKWKHRYATDLPSWLKSLAEWDALQSYATLHYNQPDFAFAELVPELTIEGEQVGHPLIHKNERIHNPVTLGKNSAVMLITGANMAGKSTYLRTIGVNYILAATGSPVCASKWSSPLAILRSGMRTSDSLQEHQSYFFAELNRLQSIMLDLKAGKPMIILLDEILKGTNSTDKQAGSRELIKQFLFYPALVFLATHDVALGDLQDQYPGKVINTCFEGKIENDQLKFDYQLQAGVAKKANATFLMQKMGIIPSAG